MVANKFNMSGTDYAAINSQENDILNIEKEIKYPTPRGRGRPPKKVKMEEDSNSFDPKYHDISAVNVDNNLSTQTSNIISDILNSSANRRTRRSAKMLGEIVYNSSDVETNRNEQDDLYEVPTTDIVEVEEKSLVINEDNSVVRTHDNIQCHANDTVTEINHISNIDVNVETDNFNQRSSYNCTENSIESSGCCIGRKF